MKGNISSTTAQNTIERTNVSRKNVNSNFTRDKSKIHQFSSADNVVIKAIKVAVKAHIYRSSRRAIGFRIMRSPEFRTCLLSRADVKQMEHSLYCHVEVEKNCA